MTEQEKVAKLESFINEGVRDITPKDDIKVESYINANKNIKDLFEKNDKQTFIKEIANKIEYYSKVESERGKANYEAFLDVFNEYNKLF